ncbi:MAG: hypothetical protein HY282_16695 [Nitrospirae bacterium]|nr:hypothetical protein [Candidatus Manganitrophaceae bacterium]
MAKVSKKRRQFMIRKKRNLRDKVKRLERQYTTARSRGEKEDILARIRKVSPTYSPERIVQAAK